MGRVDSKVAIVSGAGNGQGKAEAKLLAQEGAKVAIGDLRDDDGKAVAEEINQSGGEAMFVHLDVTNEDSWIQAIDAVVGAFGRLNVLVNNAGLSGSSQADLMGTDGWHKIMAVNATGPFLGIKHAVPRMRAAGGGSIVNVASISAMTAGELAAAYHASKGAVRSLARSAALQFAAERIRVNTVFPGPVNTPMLWEAYQPAHVGRFDTEHPMGRMAEPEEIAYGVLFLASDESSYMTGAELVIDGGWTAQ